MSEAKHTPGLWFIKKEFSNGCEVGPWIMTDRLPNGKRTIVAKIGGAPYLSDDKGAEIYANARLIAAAPLMLTILESISRYEPEADSDIERNAMIAVYAKSVAADATAKATGSAIGGGR